MPGTVDQRDLQQRLSGLEPGPVRGQRWPQARGQRHREAREAQVERDAALAALRLLVEGGRGGRGTQRPGQRRLAAVDVAQHAHVHVHPRPCHAAATAGSDTRPARPSLRTGAAAVRPVKRPPRATGAPGAPVPAPKLPPSGRSPRGRSGASKTGPDFWDVLALRSLMLGIFRSIHLLISTNAYEVPTG